MFYDRQSELNKKNYKKMLGIIGSLSNLFSDSDVPYLHYRAHENCFCKYFDADNRGRDDSSADATKNDIGIGLKTWAGNNDQKIAEFGLLRPNYEDLDGIDLVRKISEYRNERIRVTRNLYGLNRMIYHIIKRIPHAMRIYESSFDYIDLESISIIKDKGNYNNTYFTDGKHKYHFSKSKNTLYMIFEGMELLDQFEVNILKDPYELLASVFSEENKKNKEHKWWFFFDFDKQTKESKNQLCLRLYSEKNGEKFVPLKSGLNQWNASGRTRHPDELYIPYPVYDRNRKLDFFPPRDICFNLKLPDGKVISAKVCQQDSKAIMSNPNKDLGHWLLRDVFELKENTIVTYEMLQMFNIDSVMFTKIDDLNYEVDFCSIGTYENSLYENE